MNEEGGCEMRVSGFVRRVGERGGSVGLFEGRVGIVVMRVGGSVTW